MSSLLLTWLAGPEGELGLTFEACRDTNIWQSRPSAGSGLLTFLADKWLLASEWPESVRLYRVREYYHA